MSRQLICPRWAGGWTTEPAWARGVPGARAGSRLSTPPTARPPAQPTHLIGLKIVVQGKLQFPQVLRLLLLLSLSFSLCQACFCIVIILWGLQGEEGRVKRREQSSLAWHRGCEGKPALCADPGSTLGGLGPLETLPCIWFGGASPCEAQCCARCPRTSPGRGVSLVSPSLIPPPAQAPPTRVWSRHPGAGESTEVGREGRNDVRANSAAQTST